MKVAIEKNDLIVVVSMVGKAPVDMNPEEYAAFVQVMGAEPQGEPVPCTLEMAAVTDPWKSQYPMAGGQKTEDPLVNETIPLQHLTNLKTGYRCCRVAPDLNYGTGKVASIKRLREIFQIGLKEAKDMSDGVWIEPPGGISVAQMILCVRMVGGLGYIPSVMEFIATAPEPKKSEPPF